MDWPQPGDYVQLVGERHYSGIDYSLRVVSVGPKTIRAENSWGQVSRIPRDAIEPYVEPGREI